jgi:hypothetical protein
MQIFRNINSWSHELLNPTQKTFDLIFKYIDQDVEEENYDQLKLTIPELCGEGGFYKINQSGKEFKIELYFQKQSHQNGLLFYLNNFNQKIFHNIEKSFENKLYKSTLSKEQSAALLLRNFKGDKENFEKGQEILAKINHLNLAELPKELLIYIFSFLPIKSISNIMINKQFSSLLEPQADIWEIFAKSLGLKSNIKQSYEIIKNIFTIIENENYCLNLFEKTITFKADLQNIYFHGETTQILDEIHTKLPKGYFLGLQVANDFEYIVIDYRMHTLDGQFLSKQHTYSLIFGRDRFFTKNPQFPKLVPLKIFVTCENDTAYVDHVFGIKRNLSLEFQI